MASKFNKANALQPVAPIKPIEEAGFYNVPTGTASDLVLITLGAGADVANLPARKKQINHGQALEVLENGRSRRVILTGGKGEVTVEIPDLDAIAGSNKTAKKMFILALIKTNEQALHEGKLARDHVSFSLRELIDIGFYSTPQSARTGFNAGMDSLTSLKVKGRLQKSKKAGNAVDVLEVLFTGARIVKGQCFIFLNTRIDWGFIAQYFTFIPRYYFKLPNRASDLLYYIFYLARQNTREIEERGYFTISFRAIQYRLQLPNEKEARNPQRDIKQAIEDAIVQLEDEHRAMYGNEDFQLEPIYSDEAPIADFLDKGYLKVILKGHFAETFIAISKETAKKVKAAEQRQARISERAIAINEAKSQANRQRAEGGEN